MAEIAVAGAAAVLKSAIGILGNLVVQEASRLFQVKENLIWVESEMRQIQSYLEFVESKQGGSSGMANLMIDIRDLAYDVEDIVAAYFSQIASNKRKKGLFGFLRTPTSSLSYSWSARNFVVEIEGIKRRVENIKRIRETYELNTNNDHGGRGIWDARRPYLHLDELNLVGFDDHILKLKAILLNEDIRHRVISIIGFPGLGKTTLAKRVLKSVTALNSSSRRHFDCSAFVYVSKFSNIEVLLREIAGQVGLAGDKWEQNLEANLFSFLSEKKYVIVLDDIWDNQTWNFLRIGIPNNSANGSRLIITSRNRDVGSYIGGLDSLYELLPLSTVDSWELFSKIVKPPSELEFSGRRMVERCHGVPLAIVVIAGLLLTREKREHAWRRVLEGIGQDEDECRQILALSYKDLPTYAKPCFLYFGLFPEDQEVFVDELINLLVAEKFIQVDDKREELENVGEDYLNQLIARNLIQVASRRFDGRIRSCRIHDLLHNLCTSEAKNCIFFHASSDVTAKTAMRVRRVIGHTTSLMELISLNDPPHKLRTFISVFERPNEREIKSTHIKNFVRDFKFLTVLSLQCLWPSKLPRFLPKEIGNLVRLNYLLLAGEGPTELPSTISNITNLHTLDVQNCSQLIIPNIIWNMTELRHILLSYPSFRGNFWLVNMVGCPKIEVSLPNLQTLYASHIDSLKANWLPKFFNLRKMKIGFSNEKIIEVLSAATPISPKLESLHLKWDHLNVEAHPKLNLSRYENLHELHLYGFMAPEHDELPPNLTKLTLYITRFRKDPLQALKRLPKLEILIIGSLSSVGERESTVCFVGSNDFPQLERLVIQGFKELKAEEGAMPRLKKLEIPNELILTIPDNMKKIVKFLKRVKIVIHMLLHSCKHLFKALMIILSSAGVESVAAVGEHRDRFVVTGIEVDPVRMVSSIRRKVGYASIESVQ